MNIFFPKNIFRFPIKNNFPQNIWFQLHNDLIRQGCDNMSINGLTDYRFNLAVISNAFLHQTSHQSSEMVLQ